MQTTTQKALSYGLKKTRQVSDEEQRRTARQSTQSGGTKATYTALPAAQKAQYARELADHYLKSQQKSADFTKQTAAKKSGKTTYKAASSIHYSSSGRAHGGKSESFGEPSLYAQHRQQKDEARQTIRERWLNYLGTAATQSQRATAGYFSPGEQLSLARRQVDNTQAIREARARFDEANQTINWDGRRELTSALEELDRRSGWEINEDQANEIERERKKLLARLRAGDYRAGNGIRSGTDADTGRDVVGSTAKGIAGSSVNLVSNLGKNLERIDVYFPKPLDTISDLVNGQTWGTTRQQRIDAYEDPASQEKWKRIDAIADQLDYGAAQLLQRAKEGKSLAGEFVVDVAKNALEMSFDAGVALATGGSALVPMGARVYGQSVGTARRAGATLEQQTAYALTNTAIEVASERLFDGVAGIYGAGAADEITEELVGRLADTDAGRTLLRTVIGAAGEGTEDVVSDLLSPLAEAMVRDESVAELYRQLDPADVLYSYMIGVAMGTFGAGTDIATGQNAEANAELKARDAMEAEYLRRMEAIGYLPAEDSKNAAREGAAEKAYVNPQRISDISVLSTLQLRKNRSKIIAGALNPDGKRAKIHASRYYESVRHMKTDAQNIARNTGFAVQEILKIKQFIFIDKHDLGENGLRRFFPSFEMSQSWQRLIDGKNIQPHDLTLLHHEIMERQLMLEGKSQEEAHIEASEAYNYAKECEDFYGKIKKYKKE